jgi:putative addiction module component (TIGR02574 family)
MACPMSRHLDISRLSPAERIALAEELWDSLATSPELTPIPAEHLEELNRRFKAEAAGGVVTLPWEAFSRKLLSLQWPTR